MPINLPKVPSNVEADEYEDLENSVCKLVTKITSRNENGKWLDLFLGLSTCLVGVATDKEHLVHAGSKIMKGCQTCE
jgi:hypothetical protein